MLLCLSSCSVGGNNKAETSSASTSSDTSIDMTEGTESRHESDDSSGNGSSKDNQAEGSNAAESTIDESGLSESELESIYESLEDAGDYEESLADDEVGTFN